MLHNLVKNLLVVLFVLGFVSYCFSQEVGKKDSIPNPSETSENKEDNFQESLENYRNKNKFNRFVHKLLVKKPGTKKPPKLLIDLVKPNPII